MTIEQTYQRLVDIQEFTNWSNARSQDNYELSIMQYEFGSRNTYIPKDVVLNEELQNSRGLQLGKPLDEFVLAVSQQIENLEQSDLVRIEELRNFISRGTNFCEFGFRLPKLLNYYSNNGFENVTGYDISQFNVDIANKLNYRCEKLDLNNDEPNAQNVNDLVVCYHVLEHTTDPVAALKRIVKTMKDGAILHIEIPIEPGIPRLRYGHLIALEENDLSKIVEIAGMKILNLSTKTHEGGPKIERIVARNE